MNKTGASLARIKEMTDINGIDLQSVNDFSPNCLKCRLSAKATAKICLSYWETNADNKANIVIALSDDMIEKTIMQPGREIARLFKAAAADSLTGYAGGKHGRIKDRHRKVIAIITKQ